MKKETRYCNICHKDCEPDHLAEALADYELLRVQIRDNRRAIELALVNAGLISWDDDCDAAAIWLATVFPTSPYLDKVLTILNGKMAEIGA